MTSNSPELRRDRIVPTSSKSRQLPVGWRERVGLGLAALVAVGMFWEGSRQVRSLWAKPEAILVLGGAEERERFAARLAGRHPNLDIWVSSGSPRWYAERIFTRAGIALDRLHLDYRALDTVTNFTTLADELRARGIDTVYLVTSDRHMPRARLIGEIVFGSRGILLKPVSVPSQQHLPAEMPKAARDGLRSLLWVAIGQTEMPALPPTPERKRPGRVMRIPFKSSYEGD